MSDLIGQTLGHYRIVDKIGEGGMGEVYRARDEKLDRDVAIKLLPEEVAGVQDRLERFEREAKFLASLNHPNIATLHGLEDEEHHPFLVMELVKGESLASVIARGKIPFDEALPIALQVAKALEAAHEHGVIHRDLKPANVMVDSGDQVKVLDFGLAKAFDPDGSGARSPESIAESPTLTADLTRGGVLLGTAAYMSPEQAQGRPVDKRADIWAFGCVLYEMLAGSRAFGGASSTEVLAAVIKEEPDWEALPSAIPPPIRRLLTRCLTKDPRNRLHDIADVRIELQSLAAGDHDLDEPAIASSVGGRWRSWVPWGLATASLAVVILNTVIVNRKSHKTTSPPRVIRATINLPEGTELAGPGFRALNRPIRNELALSRDGGTLVFSASKSGSDLPPRLYRRRLSDSEAVEIPGTEGASSPFFSPDGRWVAYWADNEIRKISLDGGLPISLAAYVDPTGPYPPMGGYWADDGTIYIGTHLEGVQKLDPDGGRLVPVTFPDRSKEYSHRMPQVLPGGRALIYTAAFAYVGARGHIEVVSLETGEKKTIVEVGLDARYLPSGHLVYMYLGTMMAAPFDLERLELVGPAVPVAEGILHATNHRMGYFNSGAGQFAVAASGTMVYAAGDYVPDARLKFIWLDSDNGAQSDAAVTPGSISFPRISPSGRWLAYSKQGMESGLWVVDLARQSSTRLVDEGRVAFPCWTPDEERIVFDRSLGGVGNLCWVSRKGGEPVEPLTTSEFLQQPGSFTPDGRYLAYVQWRHSAGTSIWVLDMDSRESKPFLHEKHQFSYPDFSPDGRWLAYVSDESGKSEVWLTSFPDQEERFSVSNRGGWAPAWSLDGHEIFYLSELGLMVVDVTTNQSVTLGNPRILFDRPVSLSGPLRGYDVSPDGSKFIFPVLVEPESTPPSVRQLHVVLNWFEELEKLVPTESQ